LWGWAGVFVGGVTISVGDFLGFLHQPVLAMLNITLIRFAKAIFESSNFVVYVYKYVRAPLIFQDVSPLLGFYSSEPNHKRTGGEK
jgi:hypothetical protein